MVQIFAKLCYVAALTYRTFKRLLKWFNYAENFIVWNVFRKTDNRIPYFMRCVNLCLEKTDDI